MFDIYCPTHQTRVLLGPRSIESLVNTEEGVVVHWRCRCGTRGTLLTGRRPPSVNHVARSASAASAA
jgi:hypothetical protein